MEGSHEEFRLDSEAEEFQHSETFSLQSVPTFLKCSPYYLACLENVDQSEDDNTLSNVPFECRKPDNSVHTCADLECLLHTARFWCMVEVPTEVVDFCLKTSFERKHILSIKEILTEFEQNFIEVHHLKRILFDGTSNWADNVYRCISAIELNNLYMLKIVHSTLGVLSEDRWSKMITTAAEYGHLDCLIYLNSTAGNYTLTEYHAGAAAESGALTCLQYILRNSCESVSKHWLTPASAARAGKLECLQCAHQNGCKMGSFVVSFAIQRNRIDCLRYALSVECPSGPEEMNTAATLGRLECMQLLHTHGCGFDPQTCEKAASNNHLTCLVFAHTHGSILNEESHFRALKHGNLDVLRYVYEAGVPFSRRLCHTAIYHGQLECLHYMIENGCPWVNDPPKLALQFKHQHIYEYILQCGFTMNGN